MRLFSLASRTASEEDEMRRIAVGFLRLKEEQKALDYLVSFARSQPHWEKHPSFLQLKGDVFLGFAKRCINTARLGRLSPKLKVSAWDDCRRHLTEADALFQEALRLNPDPFIKELLERNLSFLQDLKLQAQKPPRSPRQG